MRKGDPVSGWIIVDKPVGIGSTSVVNIIRRIFNAQKAGHAGTLDPGASGVLPVALGEATKTIPYVVDGNKEYGFTVKFGQSTTTDDADGTVLATSDKIPTQEEIEQVIPFFIGEIDQKPPKFSAIHINGQRAYDLARKEVEIDMPVKKITIDELKLVGQESNDSFSFEVKCHKGTYVRSIGRDLAEKLGTVAHVTALRRLKCSKFFIKDAFMLEKIKEMGYNGTHKTLLLPIETVLDDIPALAVDEREATFLANGGFLPVREGLVENQTYQAKLENRLKAIVCVKDGMIRPVRVIL